MKRFENILKRLAALITAGIMVLMTVPSVTAADTPNTPKEEVVYVNLAADGSVKEINVVNIFELSEDGQITDYGQYQSLRNMTTTDKIDYSDGEVNISAKSGKLYYEGRTEDNEIPWDIGIEYFMDGKEVTADGLAGMSGSLRIHIGITENESCPGNFFDAYALQVSLTLDTKSCRNISAEGATVANVGSDKQITYTVLPGKGMDADITAEVTDFEMSGISLNGIPLNLSVEIDDEALTGRIAELMEAIAELDSGAQELRDGVSELRDRTQEDLKSGVSELSDGAQRLHDGAGELISGAEVLKSGTEELKNGADELDRGIRELSAGIGQIGKGLDQLNSQSSDLCEGSAAFKSALLQLNSALGGLSVSAQDLYALVNASSQIRSGIDQIVSGAEALQSAASFEGYKAVMLQNGLDIDALKQHNVEASAAMQQMTDALNKNLPLLQMLGIDTDSLMSQLENIVLLFEVNNLAIDGTGAYLDALNQNIAKLSDGAKTLQSGYAAFDSSIVTLVNMLSGLAYNMSDLATAVNTLVTEYEKLDGGIVAYTDGVAQIVAGYSQITDGCAELVNGSGALKSGTDALYGGAGELLSGITELYDGTGDLKDGAGTLDEGVSELITGIGELYDGTGELKDGTNAMREQTSGMDGEISGKIDELLKAVTGSGAKTESFVSERNTNVKSVQFVIQTDGIHAEEEEPAPEAKAELTVWQKFLKLFGLYREEGEGK